MTGRPPVSTGTLVECIQVPRYEGYVDPWAFDEIVSATEPGLYASLGGSTSSVPQLGNVSTSGVEIGTGGPLAIHTLQVLRMRLEIPEMASTALHLRTLPARLQYDL